ncbi:MAG: transcriptional regulator [Legionellales bacterium RIFCSPHIGHO2_12_FULL_42_9]|nr:MAG: transcriptional regulator [Legionellales bacterium RIFCSPHIGHO2_12_FULL_42_9]
MPYTVNKLARISGVSARTLRFYDEIGLLKPAFYGDNQYRYYEEEQLLMLQQILFFRELGFPLADIQRIVSSNDFDKIESLIAHQSRLQSDLGRTKTLLKTIDKTIKHLKGEVTMKNAELYYGFDSEKQKEHEQYLVNEGIVTQEFLNECNDKVKNWTGKEKNAFIQDIERIMDDLIAAIERKEIPSNKNVQSLMKQHYVLLKRTWTPTRSSYIGLADLYQTPEFRKFYDDRHPQLLEFMVQAMKVFAEHELL